MIETNNKVDELVGRMVEKDGSDLHLKAGAPPSARANGLLGPLEGYEELKPEDTDRSSGRSSPRT